MPLDSDAEPGLVGFLADRARHASDTRLALDAAGGVIVAVAAVVWHPAGWVLLLAIALCFAGYGGWGIADRELAEHSAAPRAAANTRALLTLRAGSAAIGAAAALLALFRLLALALGTWIS